jgi:hypothetical protein
MPATWTCSCSGKLETIGMDAASKFAHNTTLAHRVAVLREIGAPEALIAATLAGGAA